MNWRNVAFLVSVERKSGRLIRGQRLSRYTENKVMAYGFYILALILGILIGSLAGYGYRIFALQVSSTLILLGLFAAFPTIVLVYSIVFTMLNQIQRSGIKAVTQAPYWLPITWQENTLASIIANLLGFPLISITGIAAGIITFGIFTGFIIPTISASLAMVASAFMASTLTEILRILQVRFLGAVYKSSGRAAIWVRFIGSVLFFLLFYVVYFFIIYGSGALNFVQAIASAQNTAWFVPFVWLGIMLYNFSTGSLLFGLLFMILSIFFIGGLFFLGVKLNERYGLYEPPAITVTRGIYAPKAGLLGRLGFSTVEAALIRKDLKAFTRRRELMMIFIGPIVFVLIPFFQSLGGTNQTAASFTLFWVVFTSLLPGSVMAMGLGSLIIGEEGQAIWRIYAAPISPRNLVKSKYFSVVLFGLIITVITGTVSALFFGSTFKSAIILSFEAVFLVFALGAISLSNGIKGADFNELPRPRMIRMEWNIINFVACALCGLAIISPLILYTVSKIFPAFGLGFSDSITGLVISGIIAAIVTAIFYRISISNAKELLSKAQS
ncbi:MAG: hypothetical protein ACM3WQ_03700 [Chloroflexota bacterium]